MSCVLIVLLCVCVCLQVPELKRKVATLGLEAKGTKAELLARVEKYLQEQEGKGDRVGAFNQRTLGSYVSYFQKKKKNSWKRWRRRRKRS